MANSSKTIVLVTGANGGIGFEIVRQLLDDKTKHVLLGARSSEKGEAAVKALQSTNSAGTVEFLSIDVSNPDSIAAAAATVTKSHGRLDGLVNNAGIAIVPDGTSEYDKMQQTFATNATGPLLVVQAFTPLLQKSTTTPRIINVTSGLGSIGLRSDKENFMYGIESPHYRSSKSALNMITANQAVVLGKLGFKVWAYCPGYCVSNLSGGNTEANGARPTSEGARPVVNMLEGKRDGDHGKFVHDDDGEYPW